MRRSAAAIVGFWENAIVWLSGNAIVQMQLSLMVDLFPVQKLLKMQLFVPVWFLWKRNWISFCCFRVASVFQHSLSTEYARLSSSMVSERFRARAFFDLKLGKWYTIFFWLWKWEPSAFSSRGISSSKNFRKKRSEVQKLWKAFRKLISFKTFPKVSPRSPPGRRHHRLLQHLKWPPPFRRRQRPRRWCSHLEARVRGWCFPLQCCRPSWAFCPRKQSAAERHEAPSTWFRTPAAQPPRWLLRLRSLRWQFFMPFGTSFSFRRSSLRSQSRTKNRFESHPPEP